MSLARWSPRRHFVTGNGGHDAVGQERVRGDRACGPAFAFSVAVVSVCALGVLAVRVCGGGARIRAGNGVVELAADPMALQVPSDFGSFGDILAHHCRGKSWAEICEVYNGVVSPSEQCDFCDNQTLVLNQYYLNHIVAEGVEIVEWMTKSQVSGGIKCPLVHGSISGEQPLIKNFTDYGGGSAVMSADGSEPTSTTHVPAGANLTDASPATLADFSAKLAHRCQGRPWVEICEVYNGIISPSGYCQYCDEQTKALNKYFLDNMDSHGVQIVNWLTKSQHDGGVQCSLVGVEHAST